MYILLSITIVSFLGICVIILRHLPRVQALSPEEFETQFNASTPLLETLRQKILIPIQLRSKKIWLILLREGEKAVWLLRIFVLRIEALLLKIAHYIHSKRLKQNNNSNPSKYWKDIKEWKKNNTNSE